MRLLKAYLEDSEVVCDCGEKKLRKNKKKMGVEKGQETQRLFLSV
jgi:hypothetical protein